VSGCSLGKSWKGIVPRMAGTTTTTIISKRAARRIKIPPIYVYQNLSVLAGGTAAAHPLPSLSKPAASHRSNKSWTPLVTFGGIGGSEAVSRRGA